MPRFSVGQVWDTALPRARRELIVVAIKYDGWVADLRYMDTGDLLREVNLGRVARDWRMVRSLRIGKQPASPLPERA